MSAGIVWEPSMIVMNDRNIEHNLARLRTAIAEVLGVDPSYVTPEKKMRTELGASVGYLTEIDPKIAQKMKIDQLSPTDLDVMMQRDKVEELTVGDLCAVYMKMVAQEMMKLMSRL